MLVWNEKLALRYGQCSRGLLCWLILYMDTCGTVRTTAVSCAKNCATGRSVRDVFSFCGLSLAESYGAACCVNTPVCRVRLIWTETRGIARGVNGP